MFAWLSFTLPSGHCVPPARSGHRCVADSSNLYVFGGYNPDFEEAGGSENEDYPLFRELWRFHFATASWQQVRTEGYTPTELASMSGTHSFTDVDMISGGFVILFVGTQGITMKLLQIQHLACVLVLVRVPLHGHLFTRLNAAWTNSLKIPLKSD